MIAFLSPKDLYDIRLRLLRPGKEISAVQFPSDFDVGSFHIGKFIDKKLVGVVSFGKVNCKENKSENGYQLRGMAVEVSKQKKGIGLELCAFSESVLQILKADYIWCNARTSALNFYTKQGYSIVSDEFEIEDAGPHVVMVKKL